MTFWPLMLVTVIYAVQSAILLWQHNWWAALILIGYSIANIGLIRSL